VVLAYDENGPKVSDISRISKTSKRLYQKAKELRPVKNGFGIAVISTSKGLMSDKMARVEKLGGEILFKIW
jgi:small subunit ribosomal protein S8